MTINCHLKRSVTLVWESQKPDTEGKPLPQVNESVGVDPEWLEVVNPKRLKIRLIILLKAKKLNFLENKLASYCFWDHCKISAFDIIATVNAENSSYFDKIKKN